MFKAGIRFAAFLLFCGVACAQTINPNQIRPATTNGFVLTTVGGATVWAVSPSTPTFQTNSVNNLSQTTLNLEAGTGMTITNTSGGNVLFQAANGTTLPPPFPVPNGQFVAWAYPTACVTGNPTTDTYGVAICGPQAGFVAQYASRPLGNCCWNDTWSGFVMPSLPSDAVIQGVYGVEFVQHLTQTGLPAALAAGSCSTHATNSPSPDINFTGEYFTTSLGSTTAAVTGATCTLGTDSSIGPASVFDVNYINQVAIAIYYTTTHPPPLLPYAPIPINITLQTNGTTNANQGLLNLKAGTGMTLTDNGAGQITFASSAASGVTSINSTAGAYTFSFSAGAGSCSGTTCTFTGSGSGGGSVTNFVANTADWPAWLVPTVTSSTTTPTLLVAASAIPYTALTSLSANTVLGALTATTPSGLAVPDCHTVGTSALTWTAGGGFGCNTITGAVTVTSVSNSDGTLTISPTTGAVVASLALGHAQTWTALQGFNSGVNLVGTTSPFEVQGSAGTAGLCLTSAGAGATPTWGTCGGGGGGGISGLTLNFIPKAGSSTTLTANSALDDGVTTAATITSSEPIAITGATHGITIPAGTAVAGAAGKVVFSSDATNGYGEINENNTGASRICTAANGICAGGSSFTTVVAPSGDTTGATDGGAIQTACTAGNNVQLTAGTYYVGASNTPITISVPCRVVGVGKATVIQNKGTTNDVFRITYFTTWVESPWAYPTSTDQSEFAWFQLSQASTPSAGYGFDIGSGIPVSGGTFSYTMNVHIHDTVMNGLWGGVRTQTDELYAFVNDNMWRNFVGGSCIYHDAEVGSGDNHYTDDECSGLTHSGITITQGEANYFKGVKLNGSGITFTGAGPTKSMLFDEMSIETGITQPCMLDFGMGSAPVNTQFINSEQLGFTQTFCNAQNASGLAFAFNNSTATADYAAGLITNNGYATVTFPSFQDLATFAGTATTPLSSYTTSAGKTFVQYTADGASPQIMPQLSGSNSELVPGAVNSFGDVYDTLTPSSANYAVSETFTLANTTDQVGVFGRADPAANTNYVFIYDGAGNVDLYAIVAGSASLLHGQAFTWTAGATHTMKLGMTGTSISASIDGTPISGSPFTDSSVAAAGKAGSRIYAGATGTNFNVQ